MNKNRPALLTIDDENSFTDFLKQFFEPRGYKVDSASGGLEGLELLRDNDYDVVLLDLKMEGLNGDEVMRRMNALKPGIKAIFITAYNDSGNTKKRLLSEGAFAFIEKPISSLRSLEETVKEAVDPSLKREAGTMLKLLVVDDEMDICDFVKNFFKERDFEVYTAHDGEEAITVVEARKPDIILLDMKMPVMDGMSAFKEIRRINKDARVIMVTAVDDADKIEEAKKNGVLDYITKPLLLEQLERSVLTIAEQIRMGVDH